MSKGGRTSAFRKLILMMAVAVVIHFIRSIFGESMTLVVYKDYNHEMGASPTLKHASTNSSVGSPGNAHKISKPPADGNHPSISTAPSPPYFAKVPFHSLAPPTSRFAYVFMIWNVNPSRATTYRPYLANVMIAASLFSKFQSTFDVVLMIRIDYSSSHIRLPLEEELMLQGVGIRILYMPIRQWWKAQLDDGTTPRGEISAMMNKFDVWNLTEYDRVLFLDSDIIPLANLDYMFRRQISHEDPTDDQPTLHPTVVISGYLQPANGGFFVLEPNKDDYQQLQKIIYRMSRDYRDFNKTLGWGHSITPPDHWETNRQSNRGENWTFYAAHIDQGLLYHFPKYVKKQLTNIFSRKVVNYGATANGTIHVEHEWIVANESVSPFFNQTSFRPYPWLIPSNCDRITARRPDPGWPGCVPPYNHYHHFTGGDKPWNKPPPAGTLVGTKASNRAPMGRTITSSVQLWWQTLQELDQEGKITVGISNMGLILEETKTK